MHTRAPLDHPDDQTEAVTGGGFESALRRDLAGAPLVAYESRVGGVAKRVFDLSVTLFFLPVWFSALVGALFFSKISGNERVLSAEPRIGYGGRSFRLYGLRLRPTSAQVQSLRETFDELRQIARLAEDDRSVWRLILERLPQLFNVMRGDMSLVGPAPLARDAVDALKAAKRFYLSARPGVIGLGALGSASKEGTSLHRAYAQTWSLTHDVLIMWDAMNGLRNRGRLWKPSRMQGARASPEAVSRRTER